MTSLRYNRWGTALLLAALVLSMFVWPEDYEMTTEEAPLSYSVRDAANLLGVSHVTVYTEINEGRLRAFRVDGKTRVSRAALEDWIKARETETTP